MRKRRALLAVALLAALWFGVGPRLPGLIRALITPKVPFSATAAPPAPDYADDRAWSALPDRVDDGDVALAALPGLDQARAPADVFYVHPTSFLGSTWNGPWDDPELQRLSDRGGVLIQGSALNACCAVYAPYYRQANGSAFYARSPDGDAAIELAYTDIARAFDAFLRRRGPDRPFFLAAHSQGSVLARLLLVRRIAGTPLEDWFVAAYLPGGDLTVAGLREEAPSLHPCAGPTDTRCVNAWNARSPGFRSRGFEVQRADPRPLLCTNPLTWRSDEDAATAADNPGALFHDMGDEAPRPGFADAQCAGETLLVREIGTPPRDLPSRILDRLMGRGNYHPIEYQLFYLSIRQNAVDRLAAFTPPG